MDGNAIRVFKMKIILRNGLLAVVLLIFVGSCYQLNTESKKTEPSAFYFYQLAVQENIQGNLAQALKHINRAIRLNDRIALFYVLKAQMFDSLGNIDSAVYFYRKSLKLRSHAPEIFKRLGELSLRQNQPDKAAEYFRKAYIENPDSTQFLLEIARIRFAQNKPSKAKILLDEYRFEQLRNKRKLAPLYFVLKGDLAFAQGDSVKAAQLYAQSHCGSCLNETQADWAFKALLKTGDLSAYFELLSGLSKNRRFPEALLYFYRALYYQAIGNHHEALQQFERAYAKGLRTAQLLTILIHYYQTNGQALKAQQLKTELKRLTQNKHTNHTSKKMQ